MHLLLLRKVVHCACSVAHPLFLLYSQNWPLLVVVCTVGGLQVKLWILKIILFDWWTLSLLTKCWVVAHMFDLRLLGVLKPLSVPTWFVLHKVRIWILKPWQQVFHTQTRGFHPYMIGVVEPQMCLGLLYFSIACEIWGYLSMVVEAKIQAFI